MSFPPNAELVTRTRASLAYAYPDPVTVNLGIRLDALDITESPQEAETASPEIFDLIYGACAKQLTRGGPQLGRVFMVKTVQQWWFEHFAPK